MTLNTLNRNVFTQDPMTAVMLNDGVAKVTEPRTDEEWNVLEYELRSFVCEGEYKTGMERILSTYLGHLGEATQPVVWVSGFFGSGKSHLVRMLEFLWRDVEFPSGARARGITSLPAEIAAHFQELTIAGRREGGLWSVAGTLGVGSGDNVRLAVLGIFFRGAGLPEQYPAAKFIIWLKQNGWYDAVYAGVQAAGKDFAKEVRTLYVSPVIADTLLLVYPDFAGSNAEARGLLKSQFGPVTDISNGEMLETIADILALQSSVKGKIPCTLVVLDELQQFVGDYSDRAERVREMVEACSSQFGSRLLFVATGQSALTVAGAMAKLRDRFTVLVSLSDKDVETVVRQVVLRKKPSEEAGVRVVLDQCIGEIDRHLLSTKIAPNASDTSEVLLADYPLLPVRRRFWERILRAVDRAGAAGQLRSQLRVVYKAVKNVAEKPLGHVIPADEVYFEQSANMLASGALLREVDEIVRRQDDGTADGKLRSRLAATIFLISQLPTEPGSDTGIRATADALADLLVEDLKAGSTSLRKDIPQLLSGMVSAEDLMLVNDEYHLQTREGAAWGKDYRTRYTKIISDSGRIADERTRELKSACTVILKDVSLLQGVSKAVRKIDLHFTTDEPKTTGANIPVWIRDEWSVPEKTVREDAQAAGANSPLILVFLPRKNADDLTKAIAGYVAATETLSSPPTSNTREAAEARQSMVTRQSGLRRDLSNSVAIVLREAKVFQGGIEININDLRDSVALGLEASVASLYPLFSVGDDPKWDTVKTRVRQGNGDALTAVGWTKEVQDNPVCQQLISFIGSVGKKGQEIRDKFSGSTYGWPKDTVEGALLTLVQSGHLRAVSNGTPISISQLDQSKIGQTEFRTEGATITTPQRIVVEKLVKEAEVSYKAGEIVTAAPSFASEMLRLAQAAGGAAPLPLPPTTDHIELLQGLSGNALLLAIFQQKDQLTSEAKAWREAKKIADARLPRWQSLQRLLKFAKPLPVFQEVAPEAQAIVDNRSLLSDPDQVGPLCAKLTDALRTAIQTARDEHLTAYDSKFSELESSPVWAKLGANDQAQIRAANGLGALPPLKVASEADVLGSLEATPLHEWENKTAALSERVSRALLDAEKHLEPTARRVHLPSKSLKTVEDVDTYLEQARAQIMKFIDAGVPVVL
jgi:hypothetical protein